MSPERLRLFTDDDLAQIIDRVKRDINTAEYLLDQRKEHLIELLAEQERRTLDSDE